MDSAPRSLMNGILMKDFGALRGVDEDRGWRRGGTVAAACALRFVSHC